jgi:hypothetical protein
MKKWEPLLTNQPLKSGFEGLQIQDRNSERGRRKRLIKGRNIHVRSGNGQRSSTGVPPL